ncbi:MAG TPA: YncE family protein [Solirubrobacterales bacterium]|nr:YncE family protein [Solirubrobacterales bacterium]
MLPASALGTAKPGQAGKPAAAGTLVQLPGPSGCLVDRSVTRSPCARARALEEPAPLLGSRAVAVSPDGRNLYVASAASDAIAVFNRDARSGRLTQPKGAAGCIAAKGAGGCAPAIGLNGPNSVAVSPDGRNVYAASLVSEAVTVFDRNRTTGALSQLPGGGGCISGLAFPGCTNGRALVGPDVIVASPDGDNVYVGSFFGNAIAVFNRDPSSGALTQPGGGGGCLAETATSGCATGIALESIEGMAISRNGTSLYLGAAASAAAVVLGRNPSSGALTQATDGSGCIVSVPLAGCTTGAQLGGADAVAISPDGGDVYLTSLFSKSVTSFTRSTASGLLTQKFGSAGCLVFLRSTGCSFGRALSAPEGLAVSPDGFNLYVASYAPGAIAVLARDRRSGSVAQKPHRAGCVGSLPDCSPARALDGVGSLVLSPDGRYLYAAASKSNAIAIFRRVTRQPHSG